MADVSFWLTHDDAEELHRHHAIGLYFAALAGATTLPALINGFKALSGAALADGALDKKTKELIALPLGVAAHCDARLGFQGAR